MNKMKLDLESLQIESFDTSEAREDRGTVNGHESEAGHSYAGTCGTHCWGLCGGGGDDHGPSVTQCTQILNCELEPQTYYLNC